MTKRVTPNIMDSIAKLIPDAWLVGDSSLGGSSPYRDAYMEYLLNRLEPPHVFLEEAIRARSLYV